ncbi:tetratricopeptide repeat protein [Candidatus Margulisiibacteriota bacterium]
MKLIYIGFFIFVTELVVVFFLPIASFASETSAYINNKKGIKSYQKEDYPKALEYFSRALSESPKNNPFYYNLGNVYYKSENYEKAAENYESALKGLPLQAKAKVLYNLGNTKFKAGDSKKALEYYMKSLELDNTQLNAKYNLELVQKQLLKPTSNIEDGSTGSPTEKNEKDKKRKEQQKKESVDEKLKQKIEKEREKLRHSQEQKKEQTKNILNMLEQKETEARKKYQKVKDLQITTGEHDW